jgi:hypothetical protein
MKGRLLSILLLLAATPAGAHTINYQLDRMSGGAVFGKYLLMGFKHIIPLGFDHILFITCLFFLNTQLKKIILQASMFTVAHSVTLALAMSGFIKPPAAVVEPLIAFSIVLLAGENLFTGKLRSFRLAMVFAFGMVHGMGFAGALSELGIPTYAFATALISFNLGVELGQLLIIASLYLLLARNFSARPWYRKAIVIPVNVLIAIFASVLTVERIFFSS